MKNSPVAEAQPEEPNHLLWRFQKQLSKVEQLMNASMRPLMRQDLHLSEEANRQALATLERWSELYRHGLEASGRMAELGEDWLSEAHQRLDLTIEELRKLDGTNEVMATQKEAEKAKHFLEVVDNITRLIIPLADEAQTPLARNIPAPVI